jgi:hypothetical protein
MMSSCTGKTYQEIWEEFLRQNYYPVSESELRQIHKKWKALGSSVWKGVVLK